jgi:ABC-2 type transport system ATP-binding protein
MTAIPPGLEEWRLTLKANGNELEYTFDAKAEHKGIASLLRRMSELGIGFKDLNSQESSLEDIFVSLTSHHA